MESDVIPGLLPISVQPEPSHCASAEAGTGGLEQWA